MDAIERYEGLKRQLERLRSEQDRKQGSLDGLMKRLKEEYGVKTLEAAEKEIKREVAKAERLEEEVEPELDEVERMIK